MLIQAGVYMHVDIAVDIMKMQESIANVSITCIYMYTLMQTHAFIYSPTHSNVAGWKFIPVVKHSHELL